MHVYTDINIQIILYKMYFLALRLVVLLYVCPNCLLCMSRACDLRNFSATPAVYKALPRFDVHFPIQLGRKEEGWECAAVPRDRRPAGQY